MATMVGSSERPSSFWLEAAGASASSPLFRGLSDSELTKLFASGTHHRARRHQLLYCAGEELSHFYVVQLGSVKLVRHSPEGKELILSLVGPGEGCGPFAEKVEANELAEALEDTSYTLLPLAAVRHAMTQNATLAMNLLAHAQRVRSEAEAAMSRLVFRTVPQRLAHLLATETDRSTGKLAFPLTQSEIANLIGSSRETVCSLLNQFRRQGLVRIERGQVRVVDRPGLEAER